MSAFDITMTSRHGQSRYLANSTGVHEQLREIGLEWKTADYLHDAEVVITIRPSTITAEQERARFETALADIIEISENARAQ